MEDYFDKAIPQFIARVDQALELIPVDLSDEQLVLASRCMNKLQESRSKLEYLAGDAKIRQVQYKTERFREFQRIVRDIEYVETVGIAALERSNDVDEKLNRLVQKIRKEIDYPLRLPPAVTTISRDYFYVHTRFNFNLICVPPGERHSLLHLPDLYHELAHPLLIEKDPSQIRVFQEALTKIRDLVLSHFVEEIDARSRRRGPDLYKKQPELWLQNWYRSWSTEFLCDLFATYTLGPAFVWAHYHLCAKKTVDPFETPSTDQTTHPADDVRMMLMLFALDRIGFTDVANTIEGRWTELIESSSSTKESEYLQCYPRKIIGQIEDIGYGAVLNMKLRVAAQNTTGYVHTILNKAWQEFWKDQQSYSDWEREQVVLLYEHCTSSSASTKSFEGSVHNNQMRENETTMKPGPEANSPKDVDVGAVFKGALSDLKTGVSSNRNLTKRFPLLKSEDIQKLELVLQEPPRGGIYDHVVFERKFYLSERLLSCFESYWKTAGTTVEEKKRMCKLFLLHEFLHIQQHVDSNTYKYSEDSKNSFRYIDYEADAFAVEVCFKSEDSDLTWNVHLANILAAHIKAGEVFANADDDTSLSAMEGDRLHRQTIWHFQYARARAFKAESSFEDLCLDRHVIIEIFRLPADGNRENLCKKDYVTMNDFQNPIEMHISWGGNRIRYHLTNRHYLDSFTKGVFFSDLDSTSESFRPLFDSNPELAGRGGQKSNSHNDDLEFEFDRVDFMQRLYSLHVDDLGKIITSIHGANQRVSSNETNARKIEQLISWAESGTGPGIIKIYESAKRLYPLHFS